MRSVVAAALVCGQWSVVIGDSVRVVAQETQQPESFLRLHYTKSEHMIPMRDGVKLFTDVDESSDTDDTIEWLLKNIPQHNGRAGRSNGL